MFIHTFSRTVVAALIAATLIVPAAQADNWAHDERAALVDPAIQTALRARTSSTVRPDDRAGTRGVDALPQPAQVAASDPFDWNRVGIGAGVAFAALLTLGSWIALRHAPPRVTNA